MFDHLKMREGLDRRQWMYAVLGMCVTILVVTIILGTGRVGEASPGGQKWEYLEFGGRLKVNAMGGRATESWWAERPTDCARAETLVGLARTLGIKSHRQGESPGSQPDWNTTDILNSLGDEGWELVNHSAGIDSSTFLFKRPR